MQNHNIIHLFKSCNGNQYSPTLKKKKTCIVNTYKIVRKYVSNDLYCIQRNDNIATHPEVDIDLSFPVSEFCSISSNS